MKDPKSGEFGGWPGGQAVDPQAHARIIREAQSEKLFFDELAEEPPRAPSLRDEILSALEDAVVGEPMGPGVRGRAMTALKALMLKKGLLEAQIEIESLPDGIGVSVLIPGPKPVVERVRVSFGEMG